MDSKHLQAPGPHLIKAWTSAEAFLTDDPLGSFEVLVADGTPYPTKLVQDAFPDIETVADLTEIEALALRCLAASVKPQRIAMPRGVVRRALGRRL